MFPLLRKELVVLHELLQHQKTAVEGVVREKVAVLHDRIADIEGVLVVVGVTTLRDLQKAAKDKGSLTVTEATLKELAAAIEYADKRQAEINATRANNAAAAANVQAAAEARAATPAELPAKPGTVPSESPTAQSDTGAAGAAQG